MIWRGVDKNGIRFTKKIDWKPSLFVDAIHGEHEGWYNIDGKPVARKTFENPVEFKEFIDNKKYIEDYPIYGQQNFASQFLNEKYPNEIEWDINKIRIYTIDIETTVNEGFPNIREANETISLITLKDSITKKIITFGLGDYVNTRPDVKYIKCQSEIVLLSKFIELWRNEPPDIVTGWNIEFFDIPYLVNRITRILGEDRARQLSPYGFLIQKFEKWSKHSSTTNEKYKIYGISQLDYMAIYKTHTYTNKAMYSLDFICNDELGEQKLTHEYKNFKEFYEKDWQRFTDYNIRDVELVDKLEDKLSLLQIHLSLSYTSKVNFEDGFKGTRRWDNIIHNYLYAKKITIPPIDYNIEKERYEGAYVKAPITGAHDWVCSFDASSLYPSIMQALNISPEKLTGVNSAIDVEKFLSNDNIDNPDNHCISPSGAMFKKDSVGHIPEIIQMFMDKRVEVKNKMLEAEQALEELGPNGDKEEINKWATVKSSNFNKQMAVKISLNSLYGALGYSGFRLYSLELSKAVT
ncbi:MAG: DNA polymerase, partial [Endozoicomonadaceae bacterium]|nr:DNA polymerase [Endozoicomonadaceae bacterium]